MDPYLCCFVGAKIRFLDELSKFISNYLQTQGFAGAPINPAQIVSATLGGIFLGVTFWKTSSLFLPIVIHVFNNSFSVLQNQFFPDFSFVDMVGGSSYAPIFIMLTYSVSLIGLWKLPIRHQ